MSEPAIQYDDSEMGSDIEDIYEDETTEVEASEPEAQDEPEAAEKVESSDDAGSPDDYKFTPKQQEVFNREMERKSAAIRDAQNKARELEQRLALYESQKQQDGEPAIPPMPQDVFADDYSQRVMEREAAIARHTEWRIREAQRAEQEQRTAYEQQQQQMQQLHTRVSTYTERARELGISERDLSLAGNAVAQIGIHRDIAEMLLDNEAGPAVTVYLSQHVGELSAMQQMTPIQAAIHIDRNIMPKVKRRAAKPPPPTESLDGKGVSSYNEGPEGATYD